MLMIRRELTEMAEASGVVINPFLIGNDDDLSCPGMMMFGERFFRVQIDSVAHLEEKEKKKRLLGNSIASQQMRSKDQIGFAGR